MFDPNFQEFPEPFEASRDNSSDRTSSNDQTELFPPTAFLRLNQTVRERILFYRSQGISALPVAARQDAVLYPLLNKQGEIVLDKEGKPKPKFTGKNPSFIDYQGIPHAIAYGRYQERLPTWQEYLNWFEVEQWGLCCLMPKSGEYRVIDVDRKNFETQEEYDSTNATLLESCPALASQHEKTKNGGDHYLVKCHADFTNFSLDGKAHHGELLKGICVCYPTPGYVLISEGEIPTVSIEALPIFPYSSCKREETNISIEKIHSIDFPAKKPALPVELSLEGQGRVVDFGRDADELAVRIEHYRKQTGKVVSLENLLTYKAKKYLYAKIKSDNLSDDTTSFINTVLGTVNDLNIEGIPFASDPYELIERGAKLNDRFDKLDRILESIDPIETLHSPFTFVGGRNRFLEIVATALGMVSDGQKCQQDLWAEWLDSRKFTPTPGYVIHEPDMKNVPNLLPDAFKNSKNVHVRAGLGTYKTGIAAMLHADSTGVLSAGFRNSLERGNVTRFNKFRKGGNKMMHLVDDQAHHLIRDKDSSFALCVDSLVRFPDESFDGKHAFIDELNSVLGHLMTSDTLKRSTKQVDEIGMFKGRAVAISKTKQLVKRAETVLTCDGYMTDDDCQYIDDMSGKSSIKILNTAQRSKKTIKRLVAVNKDGKVKPRDNSPLIFLMLEILSNRTSNQKRQIIDFACDCAEELVRIEKILLRLGYRTFLIHSDNKDCPQQKEFCDDPTVFMEKYKSEIDVVLRSPVIESGVSMENNDLFICCMGSYWGITTLNAFIQMMSRARDCDLWFIHAYDKNDRISSMSLEIWQKAALWYTGKILASDDTQQTRDRIFKDAGMIQGGKTWKYHAKRLQMEQYEKANIWKCSDWILIGSGHDLEVVPKSSKESILEEKKEITDELCLQKAEVRASTEIPTQDEYQALTNNIKRTSEEQIKLDMYFLDRNLGGEGDSPLLTDVAYLFNGIKDRGESLEVAEHRTFIKRHKEWMQLTEQKLIEGVSIELWDYDRQEKGLEMLVRQARTYITDTPMIQIKRTALIHLGICDLDDGGWHDSTSPKLLEFREKFKANPVMSVLFGNGINAEKPDHWMKALNSLTEKYGFRVVKGSRSPRSNGRKIEYQYLLSMPTESEKNVMRNESRKEIDKATGDKKLKLIGELEAMENNWNWSELEDIGCNKALNKKLEALKARVTDRNFDKDSLIIEGIPHYSEWATEGEIEAYEFMWNEALEHKKRTKDDSKCREVIAFVRDDYRILQPTDTIAVGEKSYSITTTITRPLPSLEDLKPEEIESFIASSLED